MPTDGFVLMLLIGFIFGGLSGVFLRSNRGEFIINILLGIIGAGLGAFLPVLLGSTTTVNVTNYDYLIRALVGSFLLVITASLFRSARPG